MSCIKFPAKFLLAASYLIAFAELSSFALAGEVIVDGGSVRAPIKSWKELRFAGVIKQKYDFSCGSAALATLLSFSYGRSVSEEDTFKIMFDLGDQPAIKKVGFSLLDMQTYLASIGVHANGYKVSFEKISEIGLPAITLVTNGNYHHFVVIRGVRSDEILLADPALGIRRISKEKFLAMWGGVLFVVIDDVSFGKAHFNDPHDWSVIPNAPLGRGLDQQRDGIAGGFLNLPIGNEF